MDITVCHQTRISRELRMKDYLSAKELTDVDMFWVKSTQLAEFSYEISTLKAGKELAANCRHSDSKSYTRPVIQDCASGHTKWQFLMGSY